MTVKLGLPVLCASMLFPGSLYSAQANPTEIAEQRKQAALDSIRANFPRIEQKVLSTLMFGGSSPIAFSGEARMKLQYHNFTDYPDFIEADKNYLQSGWEGNEEKVLLGMVVNPGRNTVLWAKLGFQHTMPGSRRNDDVSSEDGFTELTQRHDKANIGVAIHEDMCAGIAIRTKPASFWLKMGTTNWIEASPLTMWIAQGRAFAWEFLPWEIEQPIARYYEYSIARGEKTGRAAWHKQPFNGIHLESINLPLNLYLNFLYAKSQGGAGFEREGYDFSADISYLDQQGAVKGTGVGDSYRHVVHTRLAASRLWGEITPGFNFVMVRFDDDIAFIKKALGMSTKNPTPNFFYKEPKVFSFDVRGTIGPLVDLQADVALGFLDTTWKYTDTSIVGLKTEVTSADPKLAVFSSVILNTGLPVSLDVMYAGRGFYSPFSLANPSDLFYAFGSAQSGAGGFVGGAYTQNMAGAELSLSPELKGYGHLKFKYGQHAQLEASRDFLFFPYRLIGADMFSVFHSSYSRWGNGQLDGPLDNKYHKRLGDETYDTDAGGLYSGLLGMYECFVPYRDSASAFHNLRGLNTSVLDRSSMYYVLDSSYAKVDSVVSAHSFVPHSRKFTFNLSVDGAYDIGPLLGYKRDLFVGGFAGINGVSTSFKPLAINGDGKNMLLWSFYMRLEPAIALTEKFYILGLIGYENWKAKYAWMSINDQGEYTSGSAATGVKNVGLDHEDIAFGLGFDWGMLDRVGLHGRFKWLRHRDNAYRANDWQSPFASAEIKMWF